MMFSTIPQPNHVAPPPAQQSTTGTLSSGGESRPRKPRRQMEAVSSDVISISSSPSPKKGETEVTIERSTDGGLMFSTGS
jgi:hypothetical protein